VTHRALAFRAGRETALQRRPPPTRSADFAPRTRITTVRQSEADLGACLLQTCPNRHLDEVSKGSLSGATAQATVCQGTERVLEVDVGPGGPVAPRRGPD
jgi:hypothetical protein